jgi:hypothetical protein
MQEHATSFSTTNDDDVKRVAAVQAMTAVFTRYLSEKRKLAAVFYAMRDNRFDANLRMLKTDQEIVEIQLGKSFGAIDADFVKWFHVSGRNRRHKRLSARIVSASVIQERQRERLQIEPSEAFGVVRV